MADPPIVYDEPIDAMRPLHALRLVTESNEGTDMCDVGAARRGDATHQFRLGHARTHGLGAPIDKEDGFKWYLKAARQGHVDAELCVADAYARGVGVRADPSEARRWTARAAEHGHPDAQYNMSLTLADDPAQSAAWLRKAAEQDQVLALNNYALRLQAGEGVRQDPAAAVALLRRGAALGDAEAAYNLGNALRSGEGTGKDEEQARRYFLKAAQAGIADAQYNLGRMLARGEGGPAHAPQAKAWLQKAAAQGLGLAQAELGELLARGADDLPADRPSAVRAFRAAAEQGEPSGMFMYAMTLLQQLGADSGADRGANSSAAVGLLARAAAAGHTRAAAACVGLQRTLEGSGENVPEGLWALLAAGAAEGDPQCQHQLGSALLTGSAHLPADKLRGTKLLACVAQQRDDDRLAQTARAELKGWIRDREVASVVCLACGRRRKLKTCTGCAVARFCTAACQKELWKAHKADCKAWAVEKTEQTPAA